MPTSIAPTFSNKDSSHRKAIYFPDEWKDLCAEIVTAYRSLPENLRRGKPLGLTELRNIIMTSEDRIVDGDIIRSKILIRQDLQNWLYKGTKISDMKFWHIDKFIRTIQLKNEYYLILSRIISFREKSIKSVLSQLYHTHSKNYNQMAIMINDKISNKIFSSNLIYDEWGNADLSIPCVVGKDFNQISLYVKKSQNNIFSSILIYSYGEIENLDLSKSSKFISYFFSFFIPVFEIDGETYCLLIAFNKDQFGNLENDIIFPSSYISFGFNKSSLLVHHVQSVDDPMGVLTDIFWKHRSKSVFAKEGNGPRETELIWNINIEKRKDLLENLTNDYLIW